MHSRPSSPNLARRPRSACAGHTLVELLVALLASGIMMALITGFVSATADVRQRMGGHRPPLALDGAPR